MDSELLEKVRMAQQFYSLSIKFKERMPKAVTIFAMQICDKYTKKAKEEGAQVDEKTLIKYILK